jgi:hypothetical protein
MSRDVKREREMSRERERGEAGKEGEGRERRCRSSVAGLVSRFSKLIKDELF